MKIGNRKRATAPTEGEGRGRAPAGAHLARCSCKLHRFAGLVASQMSRGRFAVVPVSAHLITSPPPQPPAP